MSQITHAARPLVTIGIGAFAGGLFGFFPTWYPAGSWPIVFGAVCGAVLAYILEFLLKHRHILALVDSGALPPNKNVWALRQLTVEVQRELSRDYLRLQDQLIELLLNKQVRNAQYRDQFSFARLLYPLHKKHLWATSLDLWSDFLRSNEDYSQTMSLVHKEKSTDELRSQGKREQNSPPPRARVFILPVDAFIKDVISDTIAARYLATHHLDWGTQAKLLLCETEAEVFKKSTSSIPADVTKVPDFMLVDDRLVYGRIDPPLLNEYVPQPSSGLTLGIFTEPTTVTYYNQQFLQLWQQAIDIGEFSDGVSKTRTQATGEVNLDAVRLTLKTVAEDKSIDQAAFFECMRRTADDIDNASNNTERKQRYAPYLTAKKNDAALSFGEWFIKQVPQSDTLCLAIDLADIRSNSGTRFWKTWEENDHYVSWREAFHYTKNNHKRRRIFILKQWIDPLDAEFITFITSELKNGVEMGFVLKADLDQFAEHMNVADKVVFDMEWMVINANGTLDDPQVDGRTYGIDFGSKTYAGISNITLEDNSLLRRKMESNVLWHTKLWRSDPPLVHTLDAVNQIRHFQDFLHQQLPKSAHASTPTNAE